MCKKKAKKSSCEKYSWFSRMEKLAVTQAIYKQCHLLLQYFSILTQNLEFWPFMELGKIQMKKAMV